MGSYKHSLHDELEQDEDFRMNQPEPVTDWTKLEIGKFYKLSCGCEGQVVKMCAEPGHPQERGFYLVYTRMGCSDQTSHEESYRKGYGPYINFFNYDLNTEAMPATETEKPAWWDEVVGERVTHILEGH